MVIRVTGRQSLKIIARVIWRTAASADESASGSGIGVQFSEISVDDRQLLRSLIAEHSR